LRFRDIVLNYHVADAVGEDEADFSGFYFFIEEHGVHYFVEGEF